MIRSSRDCVVVPVVFTPESFEAVAEALRHVDRPEQVEVVHVLPPLDPNEFESVWTPLDPDVRKAAAREALLAHLSESFPVGIQAHVLLGDTAPAIAEFAEEQGAKLVVLRSRPRNALARFLFGSLSEQVVRLCNCPVLVLRGTPRVSRPLRIAELASS